MFRALLAAGLVGAAAAASVPLKPIEASYSLSTAKYSVDPSSTTSWYGAKGCGKQCKNQWIRYDAGSACRITGISVFSTTTTAAPRYMSLYGWDGKKWLAIAKFLNRPTKRTGSWTTAKVTPVPVRYVQLVAADNYGNVRYTQLNSIKMTGSCAALKTTPAPNANGVCPKGCTLWNDGCNHCQCTMEGRIGRCTDFQCARRGAPKCARWFVAPKKTMAPTVARRTTAPPTRRPQAARPITLPPTLPPTRPAAQKTDASAAPTRVATRARTAAPAPAEKCPVKGCRTYFNGCSTCNCNAAGQLVTCIRRSCASPGPKACVNRFLKSTSAPLNGGGAQLTLPPTAHPTASTTTHGRVRRISAYQASSTCRQPAACAAQMAVDGDLTTAWVTKDYHAGLFGAAYAPARNAWLRLDMHEDYLVDKVRVYVIARDYSSTIRRLTVSVCSSRECGLKRELRTVTVAQTKGWQDFDIPAADARYLQITAVDAHDESHVMSLYEFQVLGTQIPMPGPRVAVQSTAASSSCGVQSCVKSSVVGKFDVRTTFTSKGAMQTGSGNMYIDFMLPRAHDLMSVGIFVNSAFLRDTLGQVFLYSAADSSYRKFTKLTDVKVKMEAGWQFFDVPANPEVRYMRLYTRDVASAHGEQVYFETAFFGKPSKLTLKCRAGSVPVTSTECTTCEAGTAAFYDAVSGAFPFCRACAKGTIAPSRGSTHCVAPPKPCSHTSCALQTGKHQVCRTHGAGGGKHCKTVEFSHIHTLHHSQEARGELVTCAYNKTAKKCACTCVERSAPKAPIVVSP